jgi:hypothetical protein
MSTSSVAFTWQPATCNHIMTYCYHLQPVHLLHDRNTFLHHVLFIKTGVFRAHWDVKCRTRCSLRTKHSAASSIKLANSRTCDKTGDCTVSNRNEKLQYSSGVHTYFQCGHANLLSLMFSLWGNGCDTFLFHFMRSQLNSTSRLNSIPQVATWSDTFTSGQELQNEAHPKSASCSEPV